MTTQRLGQMVCLLLLISSSLFAQEKYLLISPSLLAQEKHFLSGGTNPGERPFCSAIILPGSTASPTGNSLEEGYLAPDTEIFGIVERSAPGADTRFEIVRRTVGSAVDQTSAESFFVLGSTFGSKTKSGTPQTCWTRVVSMETGPLSKKNPLKAVSYLTSEVFGQVVNSLRTTPTQLFVVNQNGTWGYKEASTLDQTADLLIGPAGFLRLQPAEPGEEKYGTAVRLITETRNYFVGGSAGMVLVQN
jgi:hypothetical protein